MALSAFQNKSPHMSPQHTTGSKGCNLTPVLSMCSRWRRMLQQHTGSSRWGGHAPAGWEFVRIIVHCVCPCEQAPSEIFAKIDVLRCQLQAISRCSATWLCLSVFKDWRKASTCTQSGCEECYERIGSHVKQDQAVDCNMLQGCLCICKL